MYLYQASITDLIISSLPDSRNVDNLSLGDAMNIASRARTTQYARKYGMLHEISEWEVHLNGAKDRVYECEETIRKLREEVDATDGQLEKIENGLEEIKSAMEAQRLADSTGDIDIDDSRSTVSWHSGA
jgi:chromosome segregation ATPase